MCIVHLKNVHNIQIKILRKIKSTNNVLTFKFDFRLINFKINATTQNCNC